MQDQVNTAPSTTTLSAKDQFIADCERSDIEIQEISTAEYYERLYETAKE